jgi:hypothetical protein
MDVNMYIDVMLCKPLGSTAKERDWTREIVEKLDKIKNSNKSKPKKKEAIEEVISEYFDEHGAQCHFFLQKRLHDYVTMKCEFGLGEIHEVLGKQMMKCGCKP